MGSHRPPGPLEPTLLGPLRALVDHQLHSSTCSARYRPAWFRPAQAALNCSGWRWGSSWLGSSSRESFQSH